MTRVRLLLLAVVPSLVAGGLGFGARVGHADSPHVVVAQADPWGRQAPPAPPAPPSAPAAPVMPSSGSGHHGVSVKIHNGKLQLDGVRELVSEQLERVDEVIDTLDLPSGERSRIKGRVRATKGRIRAELGRLKTIDLDQIGPEMERFGDDLEREMEGLDKDLSQYGDSVGKQFEHFGRDLAKSLIVQATPALPPATPARAAARDASDADDDDDDDKPAPDPANAQADMRAAVAGLKGVTLDPDQRAKLAQLRTDSDRQIAAAKRDLDEMSSQLTSSLADISASEADIARQIDDISKKEASIRKARILAWVRARSLLSPDQRKLVEAASKKRP
ncbi:MAG TPA: hypothetical protein VGC42_09210 [Kofleriaceae bacterium]